MRHHVMPARCSWRRLAWALLWLSLGRELVPSSAGSGTPFDPPTILLVVGAPGEESYGAQFQAWAQQWSNACHQAQARLVTTGLADPASGSDKEQLQALLANEPREATAPLWVILLGHGTFDGQEAKFNLRGPDLSAEELKGWVEPFRRPLVIVNAASSSGPFLNTLSATGRVVITATKSGFEQNFSRFGQYFSAALLDSNADLDKDGQVSLLEMFLAASQGVTEFYQTEGRLATEHALLDDTGDALGTPADWFRGIRAVKKAEGGGLPDGYRAHQLHLRPAPDEIQMPAELRARRDALELAVAQLREKKAEVREDDYYARLEALLVELARLYRTIESPAAAEPSSAPAAPK